MLGVIPGLRDHGLNPGQRLNRRSDPGVPKTWYVVCIVSAWLIYISPGLGYLLGGMSDEKEDQIMLAPPDRCVIWGKPLHLSGPVTWEL